MPRRTSPCMETNISGNCSMLLSVPESRRGIPLRARTAVLRTSRSRRQDPVGSAGEKRPAMSSLSADSGQHLFQRQNVVWRLTMFGQRLVNCRAMSVTQRQSRSAHGKTLPKQLEQPEFLFGGQFEEFSNVGITHGA